MFTNTVETLAFTQFIIAELYLIVGLITQI